MFSVYIRMSEKKVRRKGSESSNLMKQIAGRVIFKNYRVNPYILLSFPVFSDWDFQQYLHQNNNLIFKSKMVLFIYSYCFRPTRTLLLLPLIKIVGEGGGVILISYKNYWNEYSFSIFLSFASKMEWLLL